MFTSLRVRNFRAFNDLTVEPLDRVNLIAGKNDVGKTALLEAVYLHTCGCDGRAPLELNRLRGINSPATDDSISWLARDIRGRCEFRTTDTTGLPEISSVEKIDTAQLRSTAFADAANSVRLMYGHEGALAPDASHLVLRHEDREGRKCVGVNVGIATGRAATLGDVQRPLSLLISSAAQLIGDAGERDENALFSELDAEGRQDELLASLRLIEPRLQQLSLLVFNGVPGIHGQLEGIRRKMPVSLMGEGLRRMLLISLAMATAREGVVLIDEIENGLHHSVLADVWRAIGDAARRMDVQVFATTHSWECIRAAHEAFSSGGPYDFRLHRLDRLNGDIRAVTYDQSSLDTSINMSMEVR